MAKFKLYSVAAATLAFAGIASAQTPPNQCTTSAPYGANIIRAEGTTEIVGDLTVSCYGGAAGVASFQVQLPATTTITSKVLSTSGTTNTVDALAVVGAAYITGTVNTGSPNIVNFNVPLAGGGTSTSPSTVFQITNVRINASALGASAYTPVSATVFGISTLVQTSSSTVVSYVLSGITKATTNGSVSASSTTSLSNPVVCATRNAYGNNLASSPSTTSTVTNPTQPNAAYWIHFGEGFAQSFKVAGTGSTTPGFTVANNIETGILSPSNGSVGTVTSGTRLTVTLSGLPNATVWLPLTVRDDASQGFANSAGFLPFNGTGLLTMISNPTLPGSLQATVTASTSSSAPDRGVGGAATPGYFAFTPVNGVVTAYYEVTAASSAATESFSIPVALNYSANAISAISTSSTALVTFAPTGTTNFPNFAASTVAATSASKFPGCTTTLLFPFVTNTAGFDTGFTISNTSVDPFGTGNQNGSCTLYYYSGAAGSAGNTVSAAFTVNAGVTYSNLLSILNPGFSGYAIAQCTFQYAHGFALIADGYGVAPRGESQGYLALVIPDPNQNSRSSFVTPVGNTESLGN